MTSRATDAAEARDGNQGSRFEARRSHHAGVTVSGWAPPKPALTVWVTHRFIGFHAWPDAPSARSYLASEHRHLFHITVELEVGHGDREVEFHDLLDQVAFACGSIGEGRKIVDGESARLLGAMSCEAIGRYVFDAVASRWPDRWIRVDASEDGENGASVGAPVVSAVRDE